MVANCTGATLLNAQNWVQPFTDAMAKWGIDHPQRAAMFLAQVGVETENLTHFEENLNYSAARLLAVFPSHFADSADAKRVAALGPKAIANRVYANRLGNGSEASGDGWRHRGMGAIQLTGRSNQQAFFVQAGYDPDVDPASVLLSLKGAADSAGWFWKKHGLNLLADADDCDACTRIVNGPAMMKADERRALYRAALVELAE